jgi:hypothetical protein
MAENESGGMSAVGGAAKVGDVILPPRTPFWNSQDRSKISGAITSFLNLKIVRGEEDGFFLSGQNAIIQVGPDPNATDESKPDQSGVKMFTVTGNGDEYLTGSFGGLAVAVYKPAQFRPSIYTNQNWNGRLKTDGLHTYTQTGLDQRIDAVALGGVKKTWDEVIWPPYFDGDIIEAAYVENQYPKFADGSDKYVWVDLNVAGRQWGWIDTICYQTAVGVPPVARKIVSLGSKPY